MKPPRNDFKIRPNRQTQRLQKDLWDVVCAGRDHITTARSQEAAQEIADRLNMDPYALDRGQTRADRAAGSGSNYN
jgi:hypothetical protein